MVLVERTATEQGTPYMQDNHATVNPIPKTLKPIPYNLNP